MIHWNEWFLVSVTKNNNYLTFCFGGIQNFGIGFIQEIRFLVVDNSTGLRTEVKYFLGTPRIPTPMPIFSKSSSGAVFAASKYASLGYGLK